VVLAVFRSRARPVGSPAYVAQREAYVYVCEDGHIARMTNYTDIDEARAVVERLAQERADA
jgi:ketosteroid isomerase-like protein